MLAAAISLGLATAVPIAGADGGTAPGAAPASAGATSSPAQSAAPSAAPSDASSFDIPDSSASITPAAPTTAANATTSVPAPANLTVGTDDPLQGINRVSYTISQPIDRFLFRPAAMVYSHVLPKPVRDGAHNFLDNLFASQVLANDILQLRPKRALHTALRFLINSTLGVGGLFDVAKHKPFHLLAHPNGFGDTLGYYGVGPGPYLYLPVVGPGNFRDIVGWVGDAFTQPLVLNWLNEDQIDKIDLKRHKKVTFFTRTFTVTSYGEAAFIVGGLDKRARADAALKALKASSVDPYAALRSAYLQDRAGEIAQLKAPGPGTDAVGEDTVSSTAVPAFDDPLADPAAARPKPATTPPQ